MKNLSRRSFLKFGAASAAGIAAAQCPVITRMALADMGPNVFTVAVIPDTQNYCDGRYQPATSGNAWQLNIYNLPFFISQMNYLKNNASAMNLAFVTHVGDVVQNGDGSPMNFPTNYGTPQNTEWLNAVQAIDVLDSVGVPYGLAPGNHDYDNQSYKAEATKYPPLVSTPDYWTKYFGSSSKYFAGKSWYVGASDEVGYVSTGVGGASTGQWPAAGTLCNSGMSSAQVFTAGGISFLHIALEMEAGAMAIEWAQSVIDSYAGYPTIVTTHSYLSPFAASSTNKPALTDPVGPGAVKATMNGASYCKNSPNGWNSAKGIWDNLIAPNNQIFMVLCGHSWGSTHNISGNGQTINGLSTSNAIRIDRNMSGNFVYQVLSDYQGNTTMGSKGGDSWLRFMQFDVEGGNIHFYTYNTVSGARAGQTVNSINGLSDFDQLPEYSDFTLPIPAQVLEAAAQNNVKITSSAFTYNRATKLYSGKLVLTNTGTLPVTGTVGVALENMPSTITLSNSLGTDSVGCPYTSVANSGIAAGASLSIPVQFSDPTNVGISFTPVMIKI